MALTQHWKLDEVSGTTATATVGTNGTYARDASLTTSATGPGTAIVASQLFVAASSDCVTISGVSFATTVPFSIGLWIKPTTLAANLALIGINGSAESSIDLTSATVVRVRVGAGSAINFTVPAITTTDWSFILVTKAASDNVRVFKNGTESSTAAQAGGNNAMVPTRIGLRNTTFYGGNVAWVKVFNSDESENAATLYAEKTAAVSITDSLGALSLLGLNELYQ